MKLLAHGLWFRRVLVAAVSASFSSLVGAMDVAAPVLPEPDMFALLAAGAAIGILVRRKKRK